RHSVPGCCDQCGLVAPLDAGKPDAAARDKAALQRDDAVAQVVIVMDAAEALLLGAHGMKADVGADGPLPAHGVDLHLPDAHERGEVGALQTGWLLRLVVGTKGRRGSGDGEESAKSYDDEGGTHGGPPGGGVIVSAVGNRRDERGQSRT